MEKDLIRADFAQTSPGNIIEAKYFYFDTEPDPDAELSIVYGGHERCASDFEVQRSYYPWHILEFPIEGYCHLTVNSKEYSLEKGTIIGFSPGDSHHYKCDFQNPLEHIFIAFTGQKAAWLFEQSKIKELVSIQPYDIDRAKTIVKSILQAGFDKTEHSQQLCSCYLKTLLLEQANKIELSGNYLTAAEINYRSCLAYIEENLSQITLPSEVAAASGINVRYMSRLFKRFGNKTPQEYLIQLKLNKAANLLLTLHLPIKDIAYLVGFEDQYHFSRTFKKIHGLTPRHYRNAHLKKTF